MTPAVDLLNKLAIDFKLHQYRHQTNAKSYGDEARIAMREFGAEPEQIFKTLLVELKTSSGDVYLASALVPVTRSLDLKSLAACLKAKKAGMASKQKVQSSTAYVLGGVSPLGQKNKLITVIDNSIDGLDTVFVSGGKRGLEVELKTRDLIRLSDAQVSLIAK